MEQHSVECTYPRNPCACKQASSEIAQSRERFEKFGRQVFLYDNGDLRRDDIGNYRHQEVQSAWFSWQAAERDTRERRDKEWIEFMQSRGWDGAVAISKRDFLKLAERIRGKE